jgi:hypothetical protein
MTKQTTDHPAKCGSHLPSLQPGVVIPQKGLPMNIKVNIKMKNDLFLPLALAVVCLFAVLSSSRAQAQSNTLPLGEVKLPESAACPVGFTGQTRCYNSTVSCPGTDDLRFTYGVVNPGGSEGTIVFFDGGDGTTPGFTEFVSAYTPPAHDFQTVQVVWSTAWEDTANGEGTSLKTAACRPATLLDWFLNQRNVYAGGGKCAQGASAGSAAVAYSLTQYGAYRYLNHVALQSGPVMSDLAAGCNPDSRTITVCPGNQCFTGPEGSWSDSPVYVDGAQQAISDWTSAWGTNACSSRNIQQSQYSEWSAMSIVDGLGGNLNDSTFFYPNTSISGWLCGKPPGCNASYCQNNSAAQGQLYYQNVTSSKKIYRVDGCLGTEGVGAGTVPALNNQSGIRSIIADMVSQCVVP